MKFIKNSGNLEKLKFEVAVEFKSPKLRAFKHRIFNVASKKLKFLEAPFNKKRKKNYLEYL